MKSMRMTYPVEIVVLQHMNVETRFELAKKCPEIRKTEKNAPIKLDQLSFTDGFTKINNNFYLFGILVDYLNEPNPAFIKMSNHKGGFRRELDQFGFMIKNEGEKEFPGDLNFTEVSDYFCSNDDNEELATSGLRWLTAHPADENLEVKISECVRYENRRNNYVPPQKRYIKFTSISGNKQKYEIVEYNKKMYEAKKFWMHKLFHGRPPIQVKDLKLEHGIKHRLPVGIKFANVARLHTHVQDVEVVRGIIDNTPLDTLIVEGLFEEFEKYFQNDLARAARRLMIWQLAGDDWTSVLAKLRNEQVWIIPSFDCNVINSNMPFISEMIEKGFSSGTTVRIECGTMEIAEEFLWRVRCQFQPIEWSESSVTVPIKNKRSILTISYEKNEDMTFWRDFGMWMNWFVELKVSDSSVFHCTHKMSPISDIIIQI